MVSVEGHYREVDGFIHYSSLLSNILLLLFSIPFRSDSFDNYLCWCRSIYEYYYQRHIRKVKLPLESPQSTFHSHTPLSSLEILSDDRQRLGWGAHLKKKLVEITSAFRLRSGPVARWGQMSWSVTIRDYEATRFHSQIPSKLSLFYVLF